MKNKALFSALAATAIAMSVAAPAFAADNMTTGAQGQTMTMTKKATWDKTCLKTVSDKRWQAVDAARKARMAAVEAARTTQHTALMAAKTKEDRAAARVAFKTAYKAAWDTFNAAKKAADEAYKTDRLTCKK